LKKISLLCLLLLSASANAVTYNITALSALSPGGDSEAYGLNDHGTVVGQSYNSNTAQMESVVWNNGVVQNLDAGGTNVNGRARDINNSGAIVGETVTFTNQFVGTLGRAYKWENGVYTDLGDLNGSWASATAINESGVITGHSFTSNQATDIGKSHGFRYENGVMTDLGTVSGNFAGYSRGEGINDAGEIVGRGSLQLFSNSEKHLIYWEADNTLHSIQAGTGNYSNAQDINNNGVIVGNARLAGSPDQKALFIDENGVETVLGTFGGDVSRFLAVNDAGIAVGSAQDADNITQAMISFDGTSIIDLNTLVIDLTGWESLDQAYDINASGQIVGVGTLSTGEQGAFLLTAVPVPAAVWLFGSALGVLGWVRRKKNS
jgi:probable HAF family extracellular repeat protein